MMHFFHQYLLYVTFEVLEPSFLGLQAALKAANTLDEVCHNFTAIQKRNPLLDVSCKLKYLGLRKYL